MWLGFLKEFIVSLIFLGTNLFSLSTIFFWSQLKLWSASQQCFGISFISQSQFLTGLLSSSEYNLRDHVSSPKYTTLQLIQSISWMILYLSAVTTYSFGFQSLCKVFSV